MLILFVCRAVFIKLAVDIRHITECALILGCVGEVYQTLDDQPIV